MSPEDLKVILMGLELAHPIMNGAGTCKTKEDVAAMARTSVSAVVLGSITPPPRPGNGGRVFYRDPKSGAVYNSLGMPNPGGDYCRQHLPEMVARCHDAGKPLIANVAGFTATDYAILTEVMFEGGADVVEENLGCPNIVDGGARKPIASFFPEYLEEVFEALRRRVGSGKRLSAKFSPFTNPLELEDRAQLVARSSFWKLFAAVTDSNTSPNGLALLPDGEDAITAPGTDGLAGVSGPPLKPVALGNIRQWKRALGREGAATQIIGAGGISTGADVVDFLRTGATAVQVVSCYFKGDGEETTPDPGVFSRILSEYVEIVAA